MSRYRHIAWPAAVPVIYTERLELAPIREKDLDEYFRLNSNSAVMKSYGVKRHTRKDQTRELIALLNKKFSRREMIRWAIRLRKERTIVGDIGFWRFIPERLRAEIAAKILPEYSREGMVCEAMIGVLDLGFKSLGLHGVEAYTEPKNLGALGLLRKLPFSKIGLVKQNAYDDVSGRFVDTLMFNCDLLEWRKFYEKGRIPHKKLLR